VLLTASSGECVANVAGITDFTVYTGRMIVTRLALTYIHTRTDLHSLITRPTFTVTMTYIHTSTDLHSLLCLRYVTHIHWWGKYFYLSI